MKLYVLRHGEAIAAAEAGGDDAARTLTERGRRQAKRAGQAMERMGMRPAVILTSPYPRAAQTARRAAKQLQERPEIYEEPKLAPGVEPGLAVELAAEFSDLGDVMVVGHNPDLEYLVGAVIGEMESGGLELRKGALAVVEIEDPWSCPARGVLTGLYSPEALKRIGG